MARTLDRAAHALRRVEFIDAAQHLMQAKGYEQMSVQDVLSELGASKGAFYHYFDSKQALLEAVVDRMADSVAANLATIVEAPDLPATGKLQRFFSDTATWKTARKELLLGLLRVWHSDDNAIVREKLRRRSLARMAPMLARIVREGTDAGQFTTRYPDQSAQVALSLVLAMGETLGEQLLAHEAGGVALEVVLRTSASYSDGLERVLGARAGSLTIVDEATLRAWFA